MIIAQILPSYNKIDKEAVKDEFAVAIAHHKHFTRTVVLSQSLGYLCVDGRILSHDGSKVINTRKRPENLPLGLPRKCDAQLIEYCKSPTPLPVHRPDDHISVLPSFVYSIGEYSQSLALFGAITVGLVKYCLFASRRGNL